MSQHIYTYDPTNDQLKEIGGAGHVIKNESGTSFAKRENLQFDGLEVSDDSTNNATIVRAVETNFVGTWAQWQALTLAEKAQYKTVDLTDDFNGDPIDAVPTENSQHAVQSGGTYAAIQTLANKTYKTDDSSETAIADDDYIPFYDSSTQTTKKISKANAKFGGGALYFTNVACAAMATTGDFATVSNANITANHVVVSVEYDNPSSIMSDVTWTTANGSVTLNGTCASATTCAIVLVEKDN